MDPESTDFDSDEDGHEDESEIFSVSGLGKGDWVDLEVFFRGNGDIIGATKIDEKLLGEMRNKEALDAAVEEARSSEDIVMVDLAERAEDPSEEAVETDWGSIVPESGVDE